MSDRGKINIRFIFVEGFKKDCSWDEVFKDATFLRDKVFEAADKHKDYDDDYYEFDDTIQDGHLVLDDGSKVKCCHFMMGERADNMMRAYILNDLYKSIAAGVKLESEYELITWICKNYRCACDVWLYCESTVGALTRTIYGPDGKSWWAGEQDPFNNYEPKDILTNHKWEDVIGEHYEKYMINVDLVS